MHSNKVNSLIAKLTSSGFAPDCFITQIEEMAPYGTDWTRQNGKPGVVLLPRNTEEVAKALSFCNELDLPVVPSGGRTGLAGGASAKQSEVVLSLSRLNAIHPVDKLGNTIRVGAGAVTQSVHEHCMKEGLIWPIDLAAKGTSQIGGNLSTNAGGVRVIRYGMTRKWVTGLKIVTMNGEIIELNRGLEKNNTGYDLIQLLVGAEGTLAVITEATLKLTKLPAKNDVFLFAVDSLDSISHLFELTRRGPFEILAFEFFARNCLEAVEKQLQRYTKLKNPSQYYVLLEIELSRGQNEQEIENWLSSVLESGHVVDGMLAHNTSEAKEIWTLREGITESLAMMGSVRKYDVAVAVDQGVAFLTSAQELFKSAKLPADLYLFGHFGDGSPHLNLVKHPETNNEQFHAHCDRFETLLFPLIKKFGGSSSAEHGVGILKKHWVTFSRTEFELSVFRLIKKAFDPKGLLNPGKLV